jgi:hypothetical protein
VGCGETSDLNDDSNGETSGDSSDDSSGDSADHLHLYLRHSEQNCLLGYLAASGDWKESVRCVQTNCCGELVPIVERPVVVI